jgi:hypothetical protein
MQFAIKRSNYPVKARMREENVYLVKDIKKEKNTMEEKALSCECKQNSWIRSFFNRICWTIDGIFARWRKSSMQIWAEREIDLACKREREGNGTSEKEWDYGCACYESAMKAFKSLLGDGHSGFSIGMTKHILNRLIDGRPLTPIVDTDDVWSDIRDYCESDGYTNYQCKRMSSLFKDVYTDGRIVYKDIDAYTCINVGDHSTYHSGLVQRVMDELFPISMPYMPSSPTKVYCDDILTDCKNGDFDTVAIYYAIRPNDERIEINRFFKEDGEDKDWVEIGIIEYADRKDMANKRVELEVSNAEPKDNSL